MLLKRHWSTRAAARIAQAELSRFLGTEHICLLESDRSCGLEQFSKFAGQFAQRCAFRLAGFRHKTQNPRFSRVLNELIMRKATHTRKTLIDLTGCDSISRRQTKGINRSAMEQVSFAVRNVKTFDKVAYPIPN